MPIETDRSKVTVEDLVTRIRSEMVPLGTLVNLRGINGPVLVQRYNLYTAAPITGSLTPGASTGAVIEEIVRG